MTLRRECEFDDLQLVYGYNSEDYPVRTLCFWDAKHKSAFDDRGFRSKGGMTNFNYYEAFVGDYPEWAKIAQRMLKEKLELPDSYDLCWKFYGDTRGYSKCTCNEPKEVPEQIIFGERFKVWKGFEAFPTKESLGTEKLQELKLSYNYINS